MSAAFIKGKLKLAREALQKKDYETARDAAASVLEYEGASYNACAQSPAMQADIVA